MIDIYGMGALNLDFIYEVSRLRDVSVPGLRLEQGGEVVGGDAHLAPLRAALERAGTLKKVSPGGSASNSCHVLSLMGYRAGLVGVLGRDAWGDRYLDAVKGADTEGVLRKGRTGLAYIINGEERDRSIVVFADPGSELLEGEVDEERLASSRWIHMTSFVSPRCLETQMRVKHALRGRVAFSVDPGEIYAAMGRKVEPLLAGIEVLFASQKEMEALFGCGLDEAVRKALGLAKCIVLKRGRQGAALFMEGFSCAARADSVDGVDNTGAGDVLNGVFLGLYLRGVEPALALQVATRAASSSIKGYGRDAYPDGRTIEGLYEDMLVHQRKG